MTNSEAKFKEIDIKSLKDLKFEEIKILMPENTGKVLTKTIIHQLYREEGNRSNYGYASTIFEYLSKYQEIKLGNGVLSILKQNIDNIELLNIILCLRLFKYLTSEECLLLAENVDIIPLLKNIFTNIQNRNQNPLLTGTPYILLNPYFFEDLCDFFKNLKGNLSYQKTQHILTFLDQTSLEGLSFPQLLSIILKLYITDPSVEDITLFFKYYDTGHFYGLNRRKLDVIEEIYKYSYLPEAALEKILIQNDKIAFQNAVSSDLFFKMGPTRLISLAKNPKLEFLESVKLIISKYKYRKKYEELLKKIVELASITDNS